MLHIDTHTFLPFFFSGAFGCRDWYDGPQSAPRPSY